MMISGRVLNSDGAAPERGAEVQLLCNGEIRGEALAGPGGWFLLERREPFFSPSSTRFTPIAANGATGFCELAVSAIGYHTRHISRSLGGSDAIENIGIIVLNRIGAPSAQAVSVRDLQVPAKAWRAYQRGLKEIERSRMEHAARWFSQAASTYPDFSAAWVAKGHCNLAAHRIAEARASFERAAAADPSSAYAAYGLGVALLALGDLTQAEQHAEFAVAHGNLEFAEPLHLLAVIRLRKGRVADAVSLLERYVNHRGARNKVAAMQQLHRLAD